jgi:hypothetical protein
MQEVGRVLVMIGIATWLGSVFVILRLLALPARADALTQRCSVSERDPHRPGLRRS